MVIWPWYLSPEFNEGAGAVTVFQKGEDGEWTELQRLPSSDMPNTRLGASLFLHDGRALVGMPGYDQQIGGVGAYHDERRLWTFLSSRYGWLYQLLLVMSRWEHQ